MSNSQGQSTNVRGLPSRPEQQDHQHGSTRISHWAAGRTRPCAFAIFAEADPAVHRDTFGWLPASIMFLPVDTHVALTAALCHAFFEAPPRSHHLRLVVVDHSLSKQSWQFQGRLLIELEHGDVRSQFDFMRPIFVQVCLFDMECLQHACSRQAEGGIARTAPHLFFRDRVDIVDAAVNDRIATDRVLHHWVDAVCRRHDPASADERGGARMLPASGHPKTAQVRESAWIALHFVAHRIRIFSIATVRQGQGLSDMVTDERGARAASSEVWTAANPTVDRRSCRQRRHLGGRTTDSAQTAKSTAEALRTPKPFWPNAKASQANGVEAWMPRNHDAESILMASCEGFSTPDSASILLRRPSESISFLERWRVAARSTASAARTKIRCSR